MQGETLQARFVRLFAGTVTIEWNGQMVPLPMGSLSPQSQALANQLASIKTPPTNPPPPVTPISPIPAKPVVIAKPTVVTENVALDEEHNCESDKMAPSLRQSLFQL